MNIYKTRFNKYTVTNGIVTMELTQGETTTFEIEDLLRVSKHRWYAKRIPHYNDGKHAMTNVKKEDGKHYPDYHARAKFSDMVSKIKGAYAPEKHEIEHKQIILNFDSTTVAGLLDSKAISPLEATAVVKELSREPLEE